MRISRLTLARYGHLADIDMSFPPAPGMHIVLGANEAGKSTALSAIGDALFRFPTRTPYAFAHATRDLRLGIELCADDGRTGSFVRRKGSKDDLSDETGQPLPESAIAAFLAGAGRERFAHLFGLDAAALRSGGQAILEGHGEVGESLLQAHTGLHGFRALVDRLGEDAARLFGDRRGKRDLHVAVDRFKEARTALDDRTVEPADYRARREEHDALEAARTAASREADRLHAERARLDRIRRTAGPRLAAARARAERAALGDAPSLPAEAEAHFLAAIAARERAAHDLAGLRSREQAQSDALHALHIDEALLAEAEEIDALAADRSRIASATRDRARQRIVAEQHLRAVALAAQRLGRADTADLANRIPDAMTRDAAERAILDHARLATLRAKLQEDVESARIQRDAASAALAALTEPPPVADLRAAIEQAKSEGRIDAERDAARQARTAAEAELTRLLASLPLWSGDAEALAALPAPLDAMSSERAAALERAEEARQAAANRHATHESALAALAVDMRDLTEAGTLPTPQAVAALRERRDRAWRLLRRWRIEGGPAPDETELHDLGLAATLPDQFQSLIREADALVDRGASEAKRIARFEDLRIRLARAETERSAAEAELGRATAAHEAALLAWNNLWSEAGIAPQTPTAMREWMTRRAAILAQRDRLAEAAARDLAVSARHASAHAALAAQLPDAGRANVGPLLAAAERVLRTHEEAATARRAALTAVESAARAEEKAARNLARTDADLAAWAKSWAEAAAALGLQPRTPPESGTVALAEWRRVEIVWRDWQAATDRIKEMTLDIEEFAHRAVAAARRVATDLADEDLHDAVRALADRLAAARAAAAERRKLAAELAGLRAEIEEREASRRSAVGAVTVLHALAGTSSDADLREAIARAAAHAALTAQIAAREAELRGLDDGKSLAELAAEADGVDLDALPGRLEDIDSRTRAIAADNAAAADRLAELRLTLAAMQAGRDAAGAAQDMADALTDIDDIAARYVRTRLAHTLLRAGIEKFRRQQQGPLLARAGALFARLTEGRYQALGVDEDEKGTPFIIGLRPDGTHCPADRLSEGTRDQLYLALRLAAIESYAEKTEPLPFIADDLLVNFDDRRARAALHVLGEMGARTQVILFTHHAHIVDLADRALSTLHLLPPEAAA